MVNRVQIQSKIYNGNYFVDVFVYVFVCLCVCVDEDVSECLCIFVCRWV